MKSGGSWLLGFILILIFILNNKTIYSMVILPYSSGGWDSITVNRINLPFSNYGSIAGYYTNGKLDDVTFLYTGGFMLSGYENDILFANGVFPSALIIDYASGNIGAPYNDPIFNIHKVSHSPFGKDWIDWKKAVSIGADFYDGNKDGIYNPEDINGDGKWNPDEDMPDVFGYANYWCVYNDAIPKAHRRFNNVSPLGIEIHQTIFGYNRENYLGNSVFIRYRIFYKGDGAAKLDSVYFSIRTDPDIGADWKDDYGGSDTLLDASYAYQTDYDTLWGNNSAVFMAQFLQTPAVYLPGETFIDANFNGTFEPDFDIPLDTAILVKGIMGVDTLPGAKNLGMTSSFVSHLGDTYIEPGSPFELRNIQIGGMGRRGNFINPCTWEFGNGASLPNCSSINPKFMFSGDPVTNAGWLPDTTKCNGCDLRLFSTTGPFTLEKEKPVDIYVAYIAVRKDSSLGSLTEARRIARMNKLFYLKNFGIEVPQPAEIEEEKIRYDFYLYPNFPNPFNPTTYIPFTTHKDGKVEIKIYNTLGEEVAKIFSGDLAAGKHKVEFNAGNLPAGIYLCQLRLGLRAQAIKIMLVK